QPYRTTEDQIAGLVLTFVDITRRKRAEEELRESTTRLRLMIENAHEYAIFSMDLDMNITSWNPGAERLLGFKESESLGRSGEIIFTPEDRANGRPAEERELAMMTGKASDDRWHMRKDGSQFFATGA